MAEEPTWFDEFSYTGYWWVPGDEEKRWAGIVTFRPDSPIKLKLLDVPDYPKAPKILWGEVPDHPHVIMLLNCTRVGRHSVSTRQSLSENQLYWAEYLLTGRWCTTADEINFESAGVTFSNLRGWMWTGMFYSQGPFVQREMEEAEETVSYKRRRTVHSFQVFSNNTDFIRIEMVEGVGTEGSNFTRLQLNKESFISIVPESPKTLEWCIDQIYIIRELLAFLTGMRVENKRISGLLDDDDTMANSVHIYLSSNPAREDETHNSSIAFSYETLGKQVTTTVFQTWFERREELTGPLSLFLGVLYGEHRLWEFQFLTLCQALESYWQTKSEEDADQIYLVDSLKGLRSVLPEKLGNELNLQADFFKKINYSRNYYAHRSRKKETDALKGLDLYNATTRLVHLFVATLALDLGIPEEKILEALGRAGFMTLWQRPKLKPLRELDDSLG